MPRYGQRMQTGEQLKNLILLSRQTIWAYQLEDYTASSLTMISRSLKKATDELIEQIGWRDFRLPADNSDALLNELQDLTLGVQKQLTGQIADAATVAGNATLAETGRILSFNGAVAEFNFVALSASQLKSMVTGTPIGGRLLNDWVNRTFDRAIISEIDEAILIGYLKGEGIPKLTSRLTKSFDLVRREAESLTRTYIAEANNQAAKAVYDANSDIVKGEEWNAHLEVNHTSGRGTCLRCAALDGRTYKLDEDHIRPPLHVSCRCFMSCKTVSYRELGLDIDEMKDMARPYTNKAGKKILKAGTFDGDFETFLKKQSAEYQKDFMGPNRLRLWKNGTIDFQDMVDKRGNVVLLRKDKDKKYIGLVN